MRVYLVVVVVVVVVVVAIVVVTCSVVTISVVVSLSNAAVVVARVVSSWLLTRIGSVSTIAKTILPFIMLGLILAPVCDTPWYWLLGLHSN